MLSSEGSVSNEPAVKTGLGLGPHLIQQNNLSSTLCGLKNWGNLEHHREAHGPSRSIKDRRCSCFLLCYIVPSNLTLKNRPLWCGRQAFSCNTRIYFTFIISVLLSTVYVTPCDAAQRRGAARCRWAGSDNSSGWKGGGKETMRDGGEEGSWGEAWKSNGW